MGAFWAWKYLYSHYKCNGVYMKFSRIFRYIHMAQEDLKYFALARNTGQNTTILACTIAPICRSIQKEQNRPGFTFFWFYMIFPWNFEVGAFFWVYLTLDLNSANHNACHTLGYGVGAPDLVLTQKIMATGRGSAMEGAAVSHRRRATARGEEAFLGSPRLTESTGVTPNSSRTHLR